jgi:hypothetical protein
MAAKYSSEMLVDFEWTTWYYIPLYIVNIVALIAINSHLPWKVYYNVS